MAIIKEHSSVIKRRGRVIDELLRRHRPVSEAIPAWIMREAYRRVPKEVA